MHIKIGDSVVQLCGIRWVISFYHLGHFILTNIVEIKTNNLSLVASPINKGGYIHLNLEAGLSTPQFLPSQMICRSTSFAGSISHARFFKP